MKNIEFNEEMRDKIHSLINFVSSITEELDDDFIVEDGLTITEGWNIFVEPVLDILLSFQLKSAELNINSACQS